MINLWIKLADGTKIEGKAYMHIDLVMQYAMDKGLDFDTLADSVIDKG